MYMHIYVYIYLYIHIAPHPHDQALVVGNPAHVAPPLGAARFRT